MEKSNPFGDSQNSMEESNPFGDSLNSMEKSDPFGTQWQIIGTLFAQLYIWKDHEMRKLTTKCSHKSSSTNALRMWPSKKKTLDDEKSKHAGLA
jgi:hypothetical protein